MRTNHKIIQNKIGLLKLAEELGNVSRACKVMGVSRDTFYRYQELVEEGGIENLIEKTRRKPNLKNRIDEATEEAVVAFALEYPAHGQVRASNELRKRGVFVSPAGVRCIWLRHDRETMKKRLKLLEQKAQAEGLILTEAHVIALERKKDDDVACGEIETATHKGAITAEGQTIGVIGTPLNDSYPRKNQELQKSIRENFLLLSEVSLSLDDPT